MVEDYPNLSATQIRDWLLERAFDLEIEDSTVRPYMKNLREIYQIEKYAHTRHRCTGKIDGQSDSGGLGRNETKDSQYVRSKGVFYRLSFSAFTT